MDLKYGTWKIDHKIGSGSYGTVYEIVRQDEIGKVYHAALKVIRIPQREEEIENLSSTGMEQDSITEYFESLVEEIIREVELMYDLNGTTNIVNYQDHVVRKLEDGISWEVLIRMELLTSLPKHLKAVKNLDRQEVIRLGIDICRALERCNKKNIIHRDIKPENIMLSTEGDYKLGDFGIARTVEGTSGEMSTKGSFNYMAPEVFKGKEYGYNIDIYSLGMVMYKLLNSNRFPFFPPYPERIHYSDENKALRRRMNGEAFPLPCNDDTRLGEIVLKACSYDPKDRYSSPADMRKDLQELLNMQEEPEEVVTIEEANAEEPVEVEIPEEADAEEPEEVVIPEEEPAEEPVEVVIPEAEPEEVETQEEEPAEEPEKVEIPEEPIVLTPPTEKKETKTESEDKTKEKNPKARIMGIVAALCIAAACIFFVVSSSSKAAIPDIQGLSVEKATTALEEAGFSVSGIIEEHSDSVDRDLVIGVKQDDEYVETGAKASVKKDIVLVNSLGVAIPVTNYVGLDGKEITKNLKDLGLKVVTDTAYNKEVAEGMIISQEPSDGTVLCLDDTVKITVSLGLRKVKVKDYKNTAYSKVKKHLEEKGIIVEIKKRYSDTVDKNDIISQSVKSGKTIYEDETMVLTVSKGIKQSEVPSVTGISRSSAESRIKDADLKVGDVDYEYSSDVDEGIVISQSLKAHSTVDHGSKVNIVVSRGEKPVETYTPSSNSGNTQQHSNQSSSNQKTSNSSNNNSNNSSNKQNDAEFDYRDLKPESGNKDNDTFSYEDLD